MLLRGRMTGVAAATMGAFAWAATGCNVDGRWTRTGGPAGPVTLVRNTGAGVDMDVASAKEVDLVENVLSHRQAYRAGLEQLLAYYRELGCAEKAAWAQYELKGVDLVKQFRYLLDTEIPAEDLHPTARIAAADEMYANALALMRKGGHGVPLIYREDRMLQAAEVFRQLIEKYPSSDKIDDAAFQLGEIHKEYLPNQDRIAVSWYERAWTWDPKTPHPARFQAAVVYQYRLQDRDRALELYRQVVEQENGDAGNVRFATRQIEELTSATPPPGRVP